MQRQFFTSLASKMMWLRVILLLGFVSFSISGSDKRRDAEECGGSFVSDSHTIEYPGEGWYTRRETCLWTIHLNSTKDFEIVFGTFDIRSASPEFDCSDAGLRIYSLFNTKDIAENYTFCSDNLPPSSLKIKGNLLSIVLYGTNNVLSEGFSLTAIGTSPDDEGTTHLSTYSRSPSGLIGYPVGESYLPSVVATWTIDKSLSVNFPDYLDISLSSLGLETCSNSDPCSCDALIIYEFDSKGLMSIKERFCSSVTNSLVQNSPSRFIVAFFSDAIKQPGNGDGFQLEYVNATAPPVPPEPNKNLPCGTVIIDRETELSYKESEQVDENERCVWIFQEERASNYRIQVFSYGVTDQNEGLSFAGVGLANEEYDPEEVEITGVGTYEVQGMIGILTFHTGPGSNKGTGFSAKITAVYYDPFPYMYFSANYVFRRPVELEYPVGNHQLAFSAFVYSPNSVADRDINKRVDLVLKSTSYCEDAMLVWLFSPSNTGANKWVSDQK